MFLVIPTETCLDKLNRYGLLGQLERIERGLGSAEDPAAPKKFFESRPPYWIRFIGSWAVVAEQRSVDGANVICLLDVLEDKSAPFVALVRNPREAKLASPSDLDLKAALAAREVAEAAEDLDPLPDDMWGWLERPGWALEDSGTDTVIYEGTVWAQWFRRKDVKRYWQDYYDLLFELISDTRAAQPSRVPPAEVMFGEDVGIMFRRFRPTQAGEREVVFLIAPLREASAEDAQIDAAAGSAGVLSLVDDATFEDIARHAERAYPDYLLGHRDAWIAIQEGEEANLALSPEEESALADLSAPGQASNLPVFLNGRAGSGKSTLLFYLFADYCDRKAERDLPGIPLFITYNERLVESARESVKRLLQYHHRFLTQRGLRDSDSRLSPIDPFFRPFRDLLLSLIREARRDRFRADNHLTFHRFSELYLGRPLLRSPGADGAAQEQGDRDRDFSLNPNREIRWSPELCWYVLRTFIKGYFADRYMSPAEYRQVPRRERVVTDDSFAAIYESVWSGWYRDLTSARFWDDQDLVRETLSESLGEGDYTAIFCDEAQDFTRVELRLIMQLSRLTSYDLGDASPVNLPFAFAGDPFQTLNPTGFRWSACRATFHDEVIEAVDPARRYGLEVQFRELLFNYRSTPPIVRLTNLIQLWRHVLFNHRDIEPQQWWGQGEFPEPEKFIIGQNVTADDLALHLADTIIVVPCEEGQEALFVREDAELAAALGEAGADGTPKNVLSAVAAKGLEFKRVVLYKFGEHCSDFVWSRDLAQEEEALAAEYFFNKLYVGATRAKEALFVIDSPEGDGKLWHYASQRAVEGFLDQSQDESIWRGLVASLAEGSDPGVMSEDDPVTIAEEFREKGESQENPLHLRRASRFYASAGKEGEARRCEAFALRFEGDFAGAGRAFEALGMNAEAWRAYWDGLCWSDLAQWYDRSPAVATSVATEIEMARAITAFMVAEPTDATALRRFAERLSDWGDAVGGPLSRQWRDASASLGLRSGQVSRAALDDEGWLEVAQALEGLSDRGHRGSKAAAALAYHNGGYRDDAIRSWESVGQTEHADYWLAKAETTPYPGKLYWLSRFPRDIASDMIFEAWAEGRTLSDVKHPLLHEVVAPVLESRAEKQGQQALTSVDGVSARGAIDLYREAFALYLTGSGRSEIDAAIRCRRAAAKLMNPRQARTSNWSWTKPLLECLIEQEEWSEIFTVLSFQDTMASNTTRRDAIAVWASMVGKLAYVRGSLFTDVFPDPEILAGLPEDRSRYRQIAARLLPERGAQPLTAPPTVRIDRDRFDELLKALRRSQWIKHLTLAEFGAAHEHAGSLIEALRFYEEHFRSRNDEQREYARHRWLVTKARQITLARDRDRGRAGELRRELDSRIGVWLGASPLG
jgi:hypothetical protein